MRKILALLLTFLLLTGCTAPAGPTEPVVEEQLLIVHFIDVGQADCALLECGGEYMLIDGGNRADGYDVVRYLRQAGVDELDLVVGTHPHEDHIGGLISVLNTFDAEQIWTTDFTYSNSVTNGFEAAARKQGTEVYEPELGETFQLGGAIVTVLGPVQEGYEDVNDTSLVLMVEFEKTRFLFTGDMEQLAEGHMLDYWGEDYDFRADVLKVGHHGSYSSSGYRLLREVAPTYGVISCGRDNEYGHPHEAPMSRLRDAEVTVYRTDLMGTVCVFSDGENLAFAWERAANMPGIPN